MRALPIKMTCPLCGSPEIVFSCEPKCCYNHVCSECTASFQPATEFLGELMRGVQPPDPLPDCTEPAAGCARCESSAVYALEDGRLVCTECGALLRLEYTEVSA
jgi:transcription elongation factor Elf1